MLDEPLEVVEHYLAGSVYGVDLIGLRFIWQSRETILLTISEHLSNIQFSGNGLLVLVR